MNVRKLERKDWSSFLDHLSKLCVGRQVEVRANSLALGDQIEARWLPLIGLTYDPKDDVIEVALEGLDHLIHRPRDVFVDDGAGLTSVEIIDVDGVKQIIEFKEPLMLPSPK